MFKTLDLLCKIFDLSERSEVYGLTIQSKLREQLCWWQKSKLQNIFVAMLEIYV